MTSDRFLHLLGPTVFALALAGTSLAVPSAAVADEHEPPQETHDGLVLVQDRKVAAAYIDPEADLSVYNKIMILDLHVAFRKDWSKDSRRSGSRIRISSSDLERIKRDTADLFRDVFIEKLSEDDGYEIVNEAGDDVLLVRPAIIDLDVSVPDADKTSRSRVYTTTAGTATLFIELYDSMTGDILARAADRKTSTSPAGYLTYRNRVTNRADARRMLSRWAHLLRTRLDELHGKTADD